LPPPPMMASAFGTLSDRVPEMRRRVAARDGDLPPEESRRPPPGTKLKECGPMCGDKCGEDCCCCCSMASAWGDAALADEAVSTGVAVATDPDSSSRRASRPRWWGCRCECSSSSSSSCCCCWD